MTNGESKTGEMDGGAMHRCFFLFCFSIHWESNVIFIDFFGQLCVELSFWYCCVILRPYGSGVVGWHLPFLQYSHDTIATVVRFVALSVTLWVVRRFRVVCPLYVGPPPRRSVFRPLVAVEFSRLTTAPPGATGVSNSFTITPIFCACTYLRVPRRP